MPVMILPLVAWVLTGENFFLLLANKKGVSIELSPGTSERCADTLGTIPDDVLSGNTCSAFSLGPVPSPDGQKIEEIMTSPMKRYVSMNVNTNLIPSVQTKR